MFTSFKNCEQKELLPGFLVQLIHTESQTFALFEIEKGAILPEHFHINEQVSQVLEGEFELTIDGKTEICKKGDIAIMKPNAVHSGKALTACKILDVFTPVREDLK